MPTSKSDLLSGVLPMENGRVAYNFVGPAPSLSKTEIHRRARQWVARTYQSSKAVLEIEDRETGDLLGNGVSNIYVARTKNAFATSKPIIYTISVEAKNEKYRVQVTNVRYRNYIYKLGPDEAPIESACYGTKKSQAALFAEIDLSIKELLGKLHAAINKDDEW
jgi:hypothetical protein